MGASKMVASIEGSHLQFKELLSLAEALSKMVASIVGSHLQFKEQLSLAETDGHFGGALSHFCLLFQKRGTSELTRGTP